MKAKTMPFVHAREFIQDLTLPSRGAYMKWYEKEQPGRLPKYPNRAYQNEWTNWNDFLGNNNKFDGTRKSYRPFTEAMAWAHRLGLKNEKSWQLYVKENKMPEDIPKAPWHVYKKDWLGWKYWLGNKAQEKIEAMRVLESIAILYVAHLPGHPNNIFKIGVERGGVSALLEKQKEYKFFIHKMFRLEQGYDWKSILVQYAKEWWEDPRFYIVTNVHQMCFDMNLEWINLTDLQA